MGKKDCTKKRSHSASKRDKKKCSATKGTKKKSRKTMTPPAKIHRTLDLDSDDNSVEDLLALDPFLPSPVKVVSTKPEAPNDESKKTHEPVHQHMQPEEHATVEKNEALNDESILAHEPVHQHMQPEEYATVEKNEALNDESILAHEPVHQHMQPEEHATVEKNEAPNDESILAHEPVHQHMQPEEHATVEKDEALNDESILAHEPVHQHMQPEEHATVEKGEAPNDESILAHEPVHQHMQPEEHATVEKDEAPNDESILAHEPVYQQMQPEEHATVQKEVDHEDVLLHLKPEAYASIEKEEDHEDDGLQRMQPEEHPTIEKEADHEDEARDEDCLQRLQPEAHASIEKEVDVPASSVRYRRRTSVGAKTGKARKVLSSDTADEIHQKLPHDPLVGKTVAFARYTPVCMSLISQLGQKFDEKGVCYDLDWKEGHIVGTVLQQNKSPPKSKKNVITNYNVIWEYTAFGDTDLAAIVLVDGEKVGQRLVRKREQLKSNANVVKKSRRRSKVEVLRAKFIKSNLTKVSDDEGNQVSNFFCYKYFMTAY